MARARSRVKVPASASTRPPEPPARPGAKGWLGLVAVLLLGALAYSSSLRGEFLFDDVESIVENPAIRDLGSFLGRSGHAVLPNRYVAYLSFALSYLAGGLDPLGWHLANLAIHVANAALVWAFVRLAFRSPRLRSSALVPSSDAIAFGSAALFVAHPLATQAVSYVVQRITSLATLFYLLAVVLYLAWRQSSGTGKRRALYAGCLVAALLAVRTKEIAFTLPASLALVEWAFLEGGWRRWLPILPVALLALLIPAGLVDLGGPASALLASADSATRVMARVSRLDYLRTEAVVVVRYLGLLALPIGQVVDHVVPIRRSWLAPDVAGCTLLLGFLVALAGWLAWRSAPRGRRPPLDPAVRLVALGIAWFFVTLSVESSIIPIVDLMNEHRVYLPSSVLFPAVATLVALLFLRVDPGQVARDTALACGLASLILGVATWNRNLVWRTERALWTDAAEKSPGHWRAISNLGAALVKQKQFEEAIPVMRRGIQIDPASVSGRVQLGVVLYLAGKPREAEAELRKAVSLEPSNPDALFNLARFLGLTGRGAEARVYLERLLPLATDPATREWAKAELAN